MRNRISANGPGAIVGALLLVIIIAWLLWPSPYSRVVNLRSGGSTIVAFGDSLTAGYGAGPGEDYPSRMSALLSVPIINAGVSGDTTEAALGRLENDVLAHDPRMVIVGLGGNDFLRGVDIGVTEANLRTIVRRIQQHNAMVVLLGFHFPSLTADYETMYKHVASDNGCLMIARPLAGILTDQSLKSDEIHPNARGYQLMAERIAGPCGKLLKKANAAR
jgi:acyl-CoA thioesterase-1